jgi:hypothetical protein
VRACGPDGRRCPALAAPPVCAPWSPEPPRLAHILDGMVLRSHAALPASFAPVALPSSLCDPGTLLVSAGGAAPTAPCPSEQFCSMASERWVFPQPQDDPCPSCTVVPRPPDSSTSSQQYVLAMEINPAWQQTSSSGEPLLQSATLAIACSGDSTTYTIPSNLLQQTGKQLVDDLPIDQPLSGCTAQLNFEVRQGAQSTSIQNPVVVDP